MRFILLLYVTLVIAGSGNSQEILTINKRPIIELKSYLNDNGGNNTYVHLSFTSLPNYKHIEDLKRNGILLLDYCRELTYVAAIKVGADLSVLDEFPALTYRVIKPEEKCLNFSFEDLAIGEQDFRISFFSVSAYRNYKNVLSQWHVIQMDTLSGTYLVSGNKSQLNELLNAVDLQYVELYVNEDKPDGLLDLTNHRSAIISDQALNGRHYNGQGMSVAIQDDGDIGPHIDHTGRLKVNPSDDTGAHGDLCAGILSGAGNKNPIGRGQAWGADLYAFSYGSHPLFNTSFITNRYLQDSIYVTSTSYADGCNKLYNIESKNIDLQIRNLPNLMHVFSAGNDGEKNCGYGAGAGWGNISGGNKMAKNVLCVGSVTDKDVLSAFSSRGPAVDGRLKPEICADGHAIFTTGNYNFYNSVSGTSMACPAVAGLFAQLQQAFKELYGVTPGSDLIKACIMNSADDLGNTGPDFKYGYGRVNGLKALKCIEQNNIYTGSMVTGGNISIPLVVPSGVKQLKVMVYWHDVNAVPETATANLINDIDMQLISPSGTVLPWLLDVSPAAVNSYTPATLGQDHLNNHEQIGVFNPVAGSYSIELSGYSIPSGIQNYVVVFEMLKDEIEVIYPFGGEGISAGETHVFRWDAVGNTGNFDLEISSDNGASWNPLANGISGAERFYEFSIPIGSTVSGKYLFKVNRGLISGQSQQFSIVDLPTNLKLDWICTDSLRISWNNVADALEYDIFLLGNKYMDSIASTSQNYAVLYSLDTEKEDWISVRARGLDNAVGRRCIAIRKDAGLLNCMGETDLVLYDVINPSGVINDCMEIDSAKIEIVVINQSFNAINGIELSFQQNKGVIYTENYPSSINPFDTVTIQFSQTTSLSLAAIDSFKIWISHTNEDYRINDTIFSRTAVIPGTLVSYPYLQDFEAFGLCDTLEDCDKYCALTAGWFNEINAVTDEIDWRTKSGGTPSPETGPLMDTIPGTLSGKYLYLQAGDCNNFSGKALSPCIDLSTATFPSASFYYHMHGSNMGELSVDVFSGGLWYLNYFPTISGEQGFYWKKGSMSLMPFVGEKIVLRFRGQVNGNYLSDIAIDGIEVKEDSSLMVSENESLPFNLFPNPADEFCSIAGNYSVNEITVVDITGKIHPLQVFQSGQGTSILDTRILANGIYFVICKRDNYQNVRPLLILHD